MDSRHISAGRLISQGLTGHLPDATSAAPLAAARIVQHLGCVQAQALGGALVSIALRAGTSIAAVRGA
ncbi:MAG: winged helix DNA-binding domain-containing protein, partial [Brevibacterium sp.]|nr:winged helix DNA-binding domain-containing protein [Brevibacterium sp.]